MSKRKPSKKLRCKFFIHKSDRDFGMKWATGEVLSHCVYCGKTLHHPFLFWK